MAGVLKDIINGLGPDRMREINELKEAYDSEYEDIRIKLDSLKRHEQWVGRESEHYIDLQNKMEEIIREKEKLCAEMDKVTRLLDNNSDFQKLQQMYAQMTKEHGEYEELVSKMTANVNSFDDEFKQDLRDSLDYIKACKENRDDVLNRMLEIEAIYVAQTSEMKKLQSELEEKKNSALYVSQENYSKLLKQVKDLETLVKKKNDRSGSVFLIAE